MISMLFDPLDGWDVLECPPAVAAVRQMAHQELQRQFTEQQRERERRREVVERLRRNREEVLRRQRRHGHRHDGRHRAQAAELRVERVPNGYQAPRVEEERNMQQEPPIPALDQRQNNRDRDFNFQDILDLDASGNN